MIMEHPTSYTTGARVLFLKGRHKDGKHDQRTIISISNDETEFQRRLDELYDIAKPGERIYASAGERDVKRAIRIFRERQLASEYDADPAKFYFRLHDRWASALNSPHAQAEKLWLFDCDDDGQLGLVGSELAEHYHRDRRPYRYRSKSGWHIITAPFDRTKIAEDARKLIHDNAIMLWGY